MWVMFCPLGPHIHSGGGLNLCLLAVSGTMIMQEGRKGRRENIRLAPSSTSSYSSDCDFTFFNPPFPHHQIFNSVKILGCLQASSKILPFYQNKAIPHPPSHCNVPSESAFLLQCVFHNFTISIWLRNTNSICMHCSPTCSPLGVGSSQIPPGTGSLSWRGLCVCTKLLSGSAVEETHSELSHGLLTVLNQLLMEVMNTWSNNYKLLVDITQLLKSPGGNCAMTWLWNRLRAPHGWNSHDGRFVATIRNIMKQSDSQKEW